MVNNHQYNKNYYLTIGIHFIKKPQHPLYKDITVSVGGPTWARTRDQLIMSQLL